MVKQRTVFKILALIINLMNIRLIYNMLQDQSASLGYFLIIFPMFWGVFSFILIVLLFLFRKSPRDRIDWFFIFISTPFPTLLLFLLFGFK